jgi:ribosome-associated translation inhibitor RaiA
MRSLWKRDFGIASYRYLMSTTNESNAVESLLNKLTKQANKGQNKPKPENNIGEKLYTNAQ